MKQICLFILCSFLITQSCIHETKETKPNILLIVTDHWRNDWMGCIDGTNLKTPNIDQLASEGLLFTQAICNSPQCGPSRVSFASGCYAGRMGVYENNAGVFPSEVLDFDNTQRSIYYALRENGYRVGTVGKLDLTKGAGVPQKLASGFYDDIGFDDPYDWNISSGKYLKQLFPETDLYERLEKVGYQTTGKFPLDEKYFFDNLVGDKALTMIKEYNRGDKPWFLQINFHAPHPPWNAPESYLEKYTEVELPAHINQMPENKPPSVDSLAKRFMNGVTAEDISVSKQHFAAKMTLVDDWIGKYMLFMREQGIEENTVIIFTSDHGEMMYDHGLRYKEQMYEGAVRVPLIIKAKNVAIGQKSKALAELVDLYPTIMDFAGISTKDEDIDGISLSRVLLEPSLKHKDYQFSEFTSQLEWPYAVKRMVYDGKYKLIDTNGFLELYNLAEDPEELHNYADKNEEIVNNLLAVMNNYSKKSIPPQYLPNSSPWRK